MTKPTNIDAYQFEELAKKLLRVNKIGRKIAIDFDPISLHWHPRENSVWLTGIDAFPPHKGYGTQAMKLVCDLADHHSQRIYLRPAGVADGCEEDDGSEMNMSQTIAWYKKFGFRKLKNSPVGDTIMRRRPVK
ncbi:hypothetical protein [Ferrovibrio sp.]|uniref:hypothetical protein n=1 Tax=Ferrovibrio sp. TaxID=1917215 RepID=UPI000CACB42B|nr:hypothetical protein [Ferrovibrio sp.]PJI39161.1 MAG: hypothetical protein CTR53_14775 [Ferrovibrio sp.]